MDKKIEDLEELDLDNFLRKYAIKRYLQLNPNISEDDYSLYVKKISVDDCIMISSYPHNFYYRITHTKKE